MKLGITLPQLGQWATPDNVINVARYAEELGFNSLWMLERLLFPIEPKTTYTVSPDGKLPDEYRYVLDPIITLTYAAANTKDIRVGTSVLVMPNHTPIILARQLSTLDVLSQGRLDCGLGIGWSEDEYDASNVAFKQRGARGDEFIQCLKTLWTEEQPEFHGEFYQVAKSVVNPKPVQKPHPPITVGGFHPRALKRAVLYGDGYHGVALPFNQMEDLIARLKQAAKEAGKNFDNLHIPCRAHNLVLLDESPGANREPLVGTAAQIKEDFRRYEEIGVTEIIIEMNFTPGINVDKMFKVMEQLRP